MQILNVHIRDLGTLTVRVGGNTIVPRTLLGRFYIICAILRNLHLALIILLYNSSLPEQEKFNVIIVDQLSVSIPLLRWTDAKILFYCHFPDKLLSKRDSLLKKIYRLPVDLVEELTTGTEMVGRLCDANEVMNATIGLTQDS